jgi:hypothetical protein
MLLATSLAAKFSLTFHLQSHLQPPLPSPSKPATPANCKDPLDGAEGIAQKNLNNLLDQRIREQNCYAIIEQYTWLDPRVPFVRTDGKPFDVVG